MTNIEKIIYSAGIVILCALILYVMGLL